MGWAAPAEWVLLEAKKSYHGILLILIHKYSISFHIKVLKVSWVFFLVKIYFFISKTKLSSHTKPVFCLHYIEHMLRNPVWVGSRSENNLVNTSSIEEKKKSLSIKFMNIKNKIITWKKAKFLNNRLLTFACVFFLLDFSLILIRNIPCSKPVSVYSSFFAWFEKFH